MRPTLLASLTLLVGATTAAARSYNPFSTHQQSPLTLDEEPLPVPGANPLLYCAKPDDYLLDIEKVDLAPNPPEAGKKLSINARGTLSKAVGNGTTVHLQVKYGVITLINQQVELCDYAGEVGKKCPLDKGEFALDKDVDIPAQVPPGKYTVLADVVAPGEETVTCLTATVVFGKQ